MVGARCRDGASFEVSLRALVERVLCKCGLEIVSVSRVPYISEGDQYKDYYVLWDAIIVCKSCEIAEDQDQAKTESASVPATTDASPPPAAM